MMRPQAVAVPPAKPDGLTRSTDSGVPTLSWNDNSIAETAYLLQRSADGGTTWTDIDRVTRPLDQPNTKGDVLSLADPTADPLVDYAYRVVAENTVGTGSPDYDSVTARSYSAVLSGSAPAAATGLTATQTAAGQLSVTLTWTDVATNETGYNVEKSTDGGTTWTAVGTTLLANATTAVDTDVVRGTTYLYRVSAINAAGKTASNTATITLVQAPNDLAVTATGTLDAFLTWTDASSVETGYQIQRNDGSGWTTLASTGPMSGIGSNGNYTDTTVPKGVTVSYRIVALNGPDADYSNIASVSMPSAPTGLTVKQTTPGPAAALAWTDTATNETGYWVRRSADNGASWTTLAGSANPLAASSTSYTDSAVTRGTTYLYQVAAVNAHGAAWSTAEAITFVSAPTGLASVVNVGPTVNLTWTDTSINESGFRVQRSSDNGATWTSVGSDTAANATSLSDTGVVDGGSYLYRVGALDLPDIAWSATLSVGVLKAPSPLTVTASTNPLTVRVSWTDVSAVETGSELQRSADGGMTWTPVQLLSPNRGTGTVVRVPDIGVTLGNTYTYRVIVSNAAGKAYSSLATITVAVPDMVSSVKGVAVRTGTRSETLTVTWAAQANLSGYTVQWSADAVAVAGSTNVGGTTTSYSRGLSRTPWYVRVQARNQFGTGPWSAWVLVPAAP